MKSLFCYTGKLKKYNGSYYTIGITNDVLSRFLPEEGVLEVVNRTFNASADEVKGMTPITLERTEIFGCENPSTVKSMLTGHKNIYKLIRERMQDADYVFVRLPSTVGNIAVNVAKELGKPYLAEVVGCIWDSLWNHSLKGKILAPAAYLKMKKNVKNADYAVYVTEQFLQNRYPCNGKSIGCSDVLLDETNDTVLQNRIKKIREHKGKYIIATTAAINVKFKGQQYVIKALGELKKRGINNFEYQMAGSGDKSFLEKEAGKYGVSDCVKFLGTLPHDKVFGWLDTVDLYIQPSRQEGLPRAMIEAMSRGLPAIGAKTGGIPELIEEQYIFDRNHKITDGIVKCLESINKDELEKQAVKNFETAKKYNKDLLKKRRADFYKMFRDECDKRKES